MIQIIVNVDVFDLKLIIALQLFLHHDQLQLLDRDKDDFGARFFSSYDWNTNFFKADAHLVISRHLHQDVVVFILSRHTGLILVDEAQYSPQPHNLHWNLNLEQLVVLPFELDIYWLVHFIEIDSYNVIIEFWAIRANKIEWDNKAMFFTRIVPSEIDLF